MALSVRQHGGHRPSHKSAGTRGPLTPHPGTRIQTVATPRFSRSQGRSQAFALTSFAKPLAPTRENGSGVGESSPAPGRPPIALLYSIPSGSRISESRARHGHRVAGGLQPLPGGARRGPGGGAPSPVRGPGGSGGVPGESRGASRRRAVGAPARLSNRGRPAGASNGKAECGHAHCARPSAVGF